jgi:alpha-ketoglutarate-dependent taurine dioxygenase
MINYKLHENGWTVFAETSIKDCTQQDVHDLEKLIATYTCVVIRNQFLTIEDELRFLKMFHNAKSLYPKDDPLFNDFALDIEKDPDGIIFRVTKELRNNKIGMADWTEGFDWHSDTPEEPDRSSILYLYGKRGTEGSRTTWNNNILAYNDLDNSIKNQIENLHSIYGNISAPSAPDHVGIVYNTDWCPPLVHQTFSGKTGMYFSPYQLGKFVELTQEQSDDIKELLTHHVLDNKYLYHHDWKDGDIVISDQWNGVHKRWPFERMDIRVLHRAGIDYTKELK